MEAQKEYFNLYVESENKDYSEDEIYDTFAYTVLEKTEINQYVDLIRKKKWGEHLIGNHRVQVVLAHTIKIFDLSNVVHTGDVYSREELLKMMPLYPEAEITPLEQFERYGADVTKEMFGDDIDLLLDQLQFDIQIEQRGINAQTDKEGSFYSEENTKEQVKSGNSVESNLTGKVLPIFPKEFSEGIIDNSNNPAFNVEKIAQVFASHFKNLKDESGQMVGVFGQWGRGKSYFINEVFKIFGSGDSSPFMMIKFQAWKYQNTQSIWAYLYETFIEEYLNVNLWNKWTRIFYLSIKRNGHWKTWIWPAIGIFIGLFAFSFTSTLTDDNERQLIIKIAGFVATVAISIDKGSSIIKKIKNPATSIFNSFSKAPSFKEVLGVQAEIQKELKNLIKAWSKKFNKKRILLFVDDLDRCSENQIIEIIDSLRVILDDELITQHILILVALDEKKLEKAISKKYENFFTKEELPEIAAEYMDKLFISAIKLFPITFDDRAEFVRKLASQINNEVYQENKPESKTNTEVPSTPTPKTEAGKEAETGSDTESKPISTPTLAPTPTTAEEKITKNLDEIEIGLFEVKIRTTKKSLTPRQIRILIYRYLLARNLWLVFFKELDFQASEAIDLIMIFSGFNKEEANTESKVNGKLSGIVRMVVAY